MSSTNVKDCCARCGTETDRLYELKYNGDDEYGDPKVFAVKVCWDCDFDIMNGGNYEEDVSDILQTRHANAYEYDPINMERPF